MPCVATFNGITVYMYFRDHNPPHVHVRYAEHEALLVIADGTVLAGNLPARPLTEVQAWLAENRQTLLSKWAQLQ